MVGVELKGGGSSGSGTDLPFIILLLATISAVFSTILSIWTVILQLKNYRKINLQRFVVRILVMVPIYSIASLVSLYSLDFAFYFDAVRDIYEAFVIYCFFTLLVEYLGGERSLIILLHGREPVPHPFPVSHFLAPMDCSDPYTFLGLKRGVLQYVQIKPVLAIATMVLKATGHYHEGYFARNSGYAYISVIYNFSVALALYCLAMFWVAVHHDLKPFRPVPKFLCVKGILFFTFWQGLSVSILVAWGWLKSERYPTDLLGLAIQDTLICFEMPLFAFLHLYAFSYTDYIDQNHAYSGRLPFFYALRDSFGYKDVLSDSMTTVKGSGFSYRTFEPASGTLHVGLSRERRQKAGLRYTNGGQQKYWLPMPGTESEAHGRKGLAGLLVKPIEGFTNLLEGRLDSNEGYAPLAEEEAEEVVHVDKTRSGERGEEYDEDEYRRWRERVERIGGEEDSDAESLVFGSEGDEIEGLYEDAKRLEFGDYNYPILDASKEAARKRMRDEEEGLINRHRITPLYSPNSTLKGKGKARNQDESKSAYGYFANSTFSTENDNLVLDNSTPAISSDHPDPEGQGLINLAKDFLSSVLPISPSSHSLTTTTTTTRSHQSSDDSNSNSTEPLLNDEAVDLVVQDFEAEEEEMIKDRRRGEPGGKKKRVYRQTYLGTPRSSGTTTTTTTTSSGSRLNTPELNDGRNLPPPSPLVLPTSIINLENGEESPHSGSGTPSNQTVEIRDTVLENLGGEEVQVVRLLVQEDQIEAERIDVPEQFVERNSEQE